MRSIERAVGSWRRLYRLFKPLERKTDAARDQVVELLKANGLEAVDTKHGTIKLMTKDTVDWQALARSVIAPAFIAQLVPQFTTKSDPYTRGLPTWSSK